MAIYKLRPHAPSGISTEPVQYPIEEIRSELEPAAHSCDRPCARHDSIYGFTGYGREHPKASNHICWLGRFVRLFMTTS